MNSTPSCWRAPAPTKKPGLKAALLDQRVVAGLGNIYVCEALYRSQLSPRRLAATLATKAGPRKSVAAGQRQERCRRTTQEALPGVNRPTRKTPVDAIHAC